MFWLDFNLIAVSGMDKTQGVRAFCFEFEVLPVMTTVGFEISFSHSTLDYLRVGPVPYAFKFVH